MSDFDLHCIKRRLDELRVQIEKAWTDEARRAAAEARKHGYTNRHTDTGKRGLVEYSHQSKPSHVVGIKSNGSWYHTQNHSDGWSATSHGSGQGAASLKAHLSGFKYK